MYRKQFALIGCPLGHSMSPFLHERLFSFSGTDASYELMEFPREELPRAVERLRAYDGFNITIPYKEAVIPLLDGIDEKARFFGSVNTVKNENGKLYGHTTDGDGFLFALAAAGVTEPGDVLLLGSGGASRAMGGTALLAGASSVTIAARNPARAEPLAADLRAIAEAKSLSCRVAVETFEALEADRASRYTLLVNGTPVGMHPHTEGCPVSADVVERCGAVFDAVYNPDETVLLRTAKRLGKTAVHGIGMLCGQAAKAQELWGLPACGREALLALSADAVAEMNRRFKGESK